MDRVVSQGFEQLLASQEQYMNDFWRRSDVRVKGIREDQTKRSTVEIQQAIRFNLFSHPAGLCARRGHGCAGEPTVANASRGALLRRT